MTEQIKIRKMTSTKEKKEKRKAVIPQLDKSLIINNRPTKDDKPKVGIEDFEIKSLIGKGAYGEVYLVIYKQTNRSMALKTMEKALVAKEGKKERVKTERRVLSEGKSPFLVRLHSSFQTATHLYLVMEYCPGGDLREFLTALGSLEEHEAVLYFAEMIMAVHHLHLLKFIHRDLKPENFLIDAKGHLKLADFGLSKSIDEEDDPKKLRASLKPTLLQFESTRIRERHSAINLHSRFRRTTNLTRGGEDRSGLTPVGEDIITDRSKSIVKPIRVPSRKQQAFSIVGSPDYMSPEVISGISSGANNKGYDEVVDWWSLGCCFFEMILGVPPFQAESADEIFQNINNWRNVLPPLLEQYRKHLSPDCFNLISGFLCEPHLRLGRDIKKLQAHPFFKNLDWNNLEKEIPPFVPKDDYVNEQLNNLG